MQVINSPRASFIRELQTTYLREDGWLEGDALDWDPNRSSDFRCLSQAIFCLEKDLCNLKGAITIAQLKKWLNIRDPFSSDFKADILDTFRIFAELVPGRKVFRKPANVLIEFTMVGLLVFVHKDTLTIDQLSDAIAKWDVKVAYVNTVTEWQYMKTMINYITSLQMPKIPGDTGGRAGATVSTAGLKRKRTEQRGESEYEDDNGKAEGRSPKAKKKYATRSNVKASSSLRTGTSHLTAAVPLKAKATPITSSVVPSQAPEPATSDRKSLRMPNIPGDTGGPAGSTGGTAGLKRKRTEQHDESEYEEDNGKAEGQKPRNSMLLGPT